MIRLRWLLCLALLALGWVVGSQVVQGYYARLQMPGILDEALQAGLSAAAAAIPASRATPADRRATLEAKLADGAAAVGVLLGPEYLRIEPAPSEVVVRVQWDVPLVPYLSLHSLQFEVSRRVPAREALGTWLVELPTRPRPRAIPAAH